jgi:ABC-type dipeptide/oligopeptide/nickel transport system permease component
VLLAYIQRRLFTLIPVMLGVTFFAFMMLHLVPVDPVVLMIEGSPTTAGPQAQLTDELYAQMRKELGLDRPLLVQYARFLGRIARGDLGESFATKRPVLDMIRANAPATVQLAMSGMGIAVLLGVIVGVIAALRRDTWLDAAVMATSVLGLSMPSFWLGIMLILIVSFQLGLLPVLSEPGWRGLILPALVLGVRAAAVISRLTRSSLVEILNVEYVRTAWAKGLAGRVVVYKHALRNALIPVVTVVGLQFGNLLSGTVVVETVFGREGLGTMALRGIDVKDFPLIQGTVLVLAVSYVCVNLLVDLSYAWLNPEIRLGEGQ